MPQAFMERQGVLVGRDHVATSRHASEDFLAWGNRVGLGGRGPQKPFQFKGFTQSIPNPKNSKLLLRAHAG